MQEQPIPGTQEPATIVRGPVTENGHHAPAETTAPEADTKTQALSMRAGVSHSLPENGAIVEAGERSPALPSDDPPRRFSRAGTWGFRIGLPLLTAIVCGASSYVVASHLPKSYRAETTLMFNSVGNQGAASIIGQLNGLGVNSPPTDSAGSVPILSGMLSSPQVASGPNTAISVMSSLRCRTMVAQACHLDTRWNLPLPKVVERLTDVVAIGVDKNGFLSIEATDNDPRLAASIDQAYITSLKSLAIRYSGLSARSNREFVESQLGAARTQLTGMENDLVRAQERSGQALSADAAKLPDTLQDLDNQATQARIDLAQTDAQIQSQIQAANKTYHSSLALPARAPYAQQSRQRLQDLETQYAVANATLGDQNPDLILLKAKLDAARAEVKSEVQNELSSVKSGIAPDVIALYTTRASLQARVAGLSSARQTLQAKVSALPQAQMVNARLASQVETQRGVVQTLQGQLTWAKLAEQRELPTFQVMDEPTPPTEPFAPRIPFITALSTVAGFLLGIAMLVGRGVSQVVPLSRDLTLR